MRDGECDFDSAGVVGACDEITDLAFQECGIPIGDLFREGKAIIYQFGVTKGGYILINLFLLLISSSTNI